MVTYRTYLHTKLILFWDSTGTYIQYGTYIAPGTVPLKEIPVLKYFPILAVFGTYPYLALLTYIVLPVFLQAFTFFVTNQSDGFFVIIQKCEFLIS